MEKFNILNLEKILKLTYRVNDGNLIQYMRDKGYLHSIVLCEDCSSVLKEMKYQRSVDGIVFVCYKRSCGERKKRVSIRKNTFFDDFKIELNKILIILGS